jgi:hypothetical protein
VDTIQNNEVQPLEFYDMKPHLAPNARGQPWDTPDPVDESIESLVGEVLLLMFLVSVNNSCIHASEVIQLYIKLKEHSWTNIKPI